MEKRALSLILLVVFAFPLVSASDIDAYKYMRTIDTSGIRVPVWVSLDAALLQATESGVEDLRLYGTSELAYHAVFEQGSGPVLIDSIEASSTQQDSRGVSYAATNMLDGTSSYYQNDFLIDRETATVKLTFPGVYKVEEIRFSFIEPPVSMNVSAVIDGSAVHLRSSSSDSASLNSVSTDTLVITFTHQGTVRISGVEVIGETGGRLLFLPDSDTTSLYYGKPADQGRTYDTSHLSTDSSTATVLPSGEKVNPSFIAGTDGGQRDNCPGISNPGQSDRDGDGVGDACDNCPLVKNKDQFDYDKDGIGDACDNCPRTYNPDQFDRDLDGIGEVCDDDDRDGIVNTEDNCAAYNPDQQDVDRDGIGDLCEDDDGDGIPNYLDLCPGIFDPDNQDTDGDGVGDACEDKDGDGIPDTEDNCPETPNPDQLDWDKDGAGDLCDNCPEHRNPGQEDIDRDGIGDACDTEESRVLENPFVVWTIMILAAIILLGLAFFLKVSKPGKTK